MLNVGICWFSAWNEKTQTPHRRWLRKTFFLFHSLLPLARECLFPHQQQLYSHVYRLSMMNDVERRTLELTIDVETSLVLSRAQNWGKIVACYFHFSSVFAHSVFVCLRDSRKRWSKQPQIENNWLENAKCLLVMLVKSQPWAENLSNDCVNILKTKRISWGVRWVAAYFAGASLWICTF